MLRWRKSPESTIKHSSGLRDPLLAGEKLAVVHPDTRHLVHEDEAALEAVVDLVITGICDAATFYLLPPDLRYNTMHIV